jgi:hypothetical protein
MKTKKYSDIRKIKITQTRVIHEMTFYATLAMTVLFFWALGGKSLPWCITFTAFGCTLDFNKKNQLELAAVTRDKKERIIRKSVALMLSVFVLLSGLGAALNRTLTVTSAEEAAKDTSGTDGMIKMWTDQYNIQINQVNTATKKEWRDTAQIKADAAMKNIQDLQSQKTTKTENAAKTESVNTMFVLLSDFFHMGKNPARFIVILLMMMQLGLEICVWVTTPQYWKDNRGIKMTGNGKNNAIDKRKYARTIKQNTSGVKNAVKKSGFELSEKELKSDAKKVLTF